MIKILFILPSLRKSGSETQIVNLANKLPSDRYKKYLLYYDDAVDLLDSISNDVCVIYIKRKSKFDYRIIRKIRRLVIENGIDIINSPVQYSAFCAYLATRFISKAAPIVLSLHYTKSLSEKQELQNKYIYRYVYPRYKKIVFVSENQRAYWMDRYPWVSDNSICIHNGVDTEIYKRELNIEQRLDYESLKASDFVVSMVAALRPEKNHLLVLQAFSKIGGNIKLLIAGDGPLKSLIEKEIMSLDIGDKVSMLGAVNDVREVLQVSNVSVLASRAEAFSMAMLESMSMSVPFISSDVGGMSEAIMHNINGFLFENGDVDALIRILEWCKDNPDELRRMGGKAREDVCSKFSEEAMLNKYDQVFSYAVNETKQVR